MIGTILYLTAIYQRLHVRNVHSHVVSQPEGLARLLGVSQSLATQSYTRLMIMKDNLLHYSAVVVFLHAALTVPHGIAHAAEQATLPAAANAFVAIVIVLAPLVALGLLWRHLHWLGGLLLLTSMLAALLFGIAFHYMLPGPDHVGYGPAGPWQMLFQLTAALLALSEAIGAIVGGVILYRLSRAPASAGVRS